MKLIDWEGDELGARFDDRPIPEELTERAATARAAMIEAIAEVDDEVMARYLDGGGPRRAELLRAALRRATIAGRAVPVLWAPPSGTRACSRC